MRVARRVRPSQVGCAATIGRRRLYAATASHSEISADTSPTARMALVIQPDGRIIAHDDDSNFHVELADNSYTTPSELLGSSASGR
jgi:hypothetical protein